MPLCPMLCCAVKARRRSIEGGRAKPPQTLVDGLLVLDRERQRWRDRAAGTLPPQPSRAAPSEFDPLAQVGVDGGPAGVPDLSATQNTWLLARRPPPRPRVRSLAHPRP